MEDFSDQITRLTEELKALQAQLQWPSIRDSNPGDQDRILDQLLNAGLGQNLKCAVDHLSQFLWCFIESAAGRTNAPEVDYAQQSLRLGEATEMLRLLHHSACPLMESLGFIEHATMTVNRHAETHPLQAKRKMEKTA